MEILSSYFIPRSQCGDQFNWLTILLRDRSIICRRHMQLRMYRPHDQNSAAQQVFARVCD